MKASPLRRWVLVLLLCVAAGAQAQAPDEVGVADKGSRIVPDRYIVQLRPGVDSVRVARQLARTHGLQVLSVYQHALKGFAAVVPAQRVELLRQDPAVLTIEPDRVVHAVAQQLPTGVNRIDADLNSIAAIDGAATNVNVDIAIIDTGVDLDHPDLNVYRFTDCVDQDLIGWLFGITCIDDNDPLNDGTLGDDLNGHGSHVAGIAAAKDNEFGVVGVAPGARIWSVAVLDQNGSGFLYWVINGIDWVTSHANEIDVANMSLAWQGNSPAARTAIQNSVNAGVVYVVAAANSSQDIFGPDLTVGTSDDWEPAAYPEVATISALADSDGQAGGSGANTSWGPDDTLATFSNFSTAAPPGNPVISPGAGIDLAAPGVSIFSTYKDGGYATLSGTSMASPHVTGAVGLYIAKNGRANTASDVAFIRQQLINNHSQPPTAWGPANTADPDNNHEDLVHMGDSAPPPAPTAPSSLAATAVSSTQIDLAWVDNSDNEDGFQIERCTGLDCAGFAQIAQVSADVNVYNDTGLAADTSYNYRVRAFNSGGDSDYSNTAQATTEPAPSSPDITLSVTGTKVKGVKTATLTWTGATSTNVDIYRDGQLIATTSNDGSYTDNIGKGSGNSFTYQVCEAGTSTCSNQETLSF